MRLARSRTAAGPVPVVASGDRWFSLSPYCSDHAAETGTAQPAEPVVFPAA